MLNSGVVSISVFMLDEPAPFTGGIGTEAGRRAADAVFN